MHVLLYQVSGIMLNGYSFAISLLCGYIVLASYFGSLAAYGYYQYKHKKRGKLIHTCIVLADSSLTFFNSLSTPHACLGL
jgi:hypothetical protein